MFSSKESNKPKVSVVIAFYNVEQFAEDCMNSLIAQDYDNCEFICVDDGSTDGTLTVLNKYSYDNRVKIFHKTNGGLSDARNFGISKATGEYITIIDGDDYVHPYYLRWLVNASCMYENTIVIGKLKVVKYNNSVKSHDWSNSFSCHNLDKKDVVEKILYNELSVSACAKLVPRKAYDTIKFPVGKVSEEVATIGLLLEKYDSFSIIDQPIYAYVMRNNSIGHQKEYTFGEVNDRFESLRLFEDKIKDMFDIESETDIKQALQYRWGLRYTDMSSTFDYVIDDKEKMQETKKEINLWMHDNISQIIFNKEAPLLQRIRIMLYYYSPKGYNKLYSVYQRIRYGIK